MLRKLLAERFRFTSHTETRQVPIYALTIGKNGSKLKEPPAKREPVEPFQGNIATRADGYPDLKMGGTITMAMQKDKARYTLSDTTLEAFALQLSGQLNAPVVNQTGLKGKYDIDLYWDAGQHEPGEDRGPDLIQAIKEQLGLNLEKTKGPIEVLVIDHAERVPAEN